MSYLALYRKYRPSNFDSLIGQEHIVKTLLNQIKFDRLGHAYLFTGTRGTGKTSAAKIFAKAINCKQPINGSPCGKCSSCIALSDPSNVDVIEIDAASNNGVNEIRDLKEKVQYPPVSCKYKVYIIDEVHMLSTPAFNALLKTLEEPPKHAIFILATTEVHKIPATILSRCMRFDFKIISTEKIAELISKIFDEEGKKYEKEAIFAIAKAGEGSIRDALSIAEIALSIDDGVLTYKDVTDILGSTNFDLLAKFIKNVITGDVGEVLGDVNNFTLVGKVMGALLKDIVSFIRDLIVVKTCSNAKSILSIPENNFNNLVDLASLCTTDRLLRILDIYSSAENLMRYSKHQSIVLECVSLKACKLENDYNFDALIARIKELEDKISSGNILVNVNKGAIEKTVSTENNEKAVSEPQTEQKNRAKLSLQGEKVNYIKGKLLYNMREVVKSKLIWNVLQGVEFDIKGEILTITTFNQNDFELLQDKNATERLKEALDEYDFEVKIVMDKDKVKQNKIDEAADEIKKIFGSDIVIIK